jgi:TonB family protein
MLVFKNHIHGIIGTLVFLASGVSLLVLLGFTTPLPVPIEEAILLDLTNIVGAESDGFSSDASDQDKASSDKNSIDKNVESINNNLYAQNFENSIFIPNGTEVNKHVNPNADKINKMFNGAFDNGNIDNGKGDNKNKNHYNGIGSKESNDKNPKGITGSIEGRKQILKISPVCKDNTFGKVIFNITVNEQGLVTDIILVSTTCNECVQAAKDAIKQWKYESKPGSGYQTGEVVIEFKQS